MPLPDRWFRRTPDSRALTAPRLLARRSVRLEELDEHIAFYEHALAIRCDTRMPVGPPGIELAMVGGLLLIGTPRPPGPVAAETAYTLLVPSVRDFLAQQQALGSEVLEPETREPSGSRSRVRFPDGTLVEAIDFRPLPDELGG